MLSSFWLLPLRFFKCSINMKHNTIIFVIGLRVHKITIIIIMMRVHTVRIDKQYRITTTIRIYGLLGIIESMKILRPENGFVGMVGAGVEVVGVEAVKWVEFLAAVFVGLGVGRFLTHRQSVGIVVRALCHIALRIDYRTVVALVIRVIEIVFAVGIDITARYQYAFKLVVVENA